MLQDASTKHLLCRAAEFASVSDYLQLFPVKTMLLLSQGLPGLQGAERNVHVVEGCCQLNLARQARAACTQPFSVQRLYGTELC